MIKQLVFTLGVATLALAGEASSKDCTVPIGSKSNYLLQWPLIFDQNGKLYATSFDDVSRQVLIKVKAGDKVTLSCGPNYFKNQFKVEILEAVCNGGTGNLTVNGTERDTTDLTCDLRVIEEVLDSVYGCVDSKLTAARFGYVDPNGKQTILLGEVCYDMAAGKTHFVHIRLGQQAPRSIETAPTNYLTSHQHPDGRYKIELFRGLFFDEIYERIRSTLNIRHAPNLKLDHFVDETLLDSAQFQAIKKLGWNYFVGYDANEALEALKLDLKHLGESSNIEIYAGSHGVQHFEGDNGENMEIYLHERQKRFPMPRVLWFVVKQGERATAFGVSNREDINHLQQQAGTNNGIDNETLCKESVCSQVSWLSADLKLDKKLICCDVNDIRKTVQEIPIFAEVKEMLL